MRLLPSIALAAALVAAFFIPALAHDPYTGQVDPVRKTSCCGGHDCAILKIEPGMIEAVPTGYHIRLTEDQARKLNPARVGPVDTVVPWERVQASFDGNYHMCIPGYRVENMVLDFYCFWAPPNS